MKPDITPIDNSNLSVVAELLYERNQTLQSYTEWKYRAGKDSRFRGVIAIAGGKPIGCFGSIPKELMFSDGNVEKCGWFADWYVSPNARGMRIGELLLNALSRYEPIMFGHPGPQIAQDICIKNGYQSIGFHSRRRLILNRWSYYWKRGALFQILKSKLIQKLMLSSVSNTGQTIRNANGKSGNLSDNEPFLRAHFVQTEYHEKWIQSQPVSNSFERKYGEWYGKGYCIKYFDERITNREERRVVLFIDGEDITAPGVWYPFIASAREAYRDYIEIFTTNRKLDSLLTQMGAWHIHEAPIMVRGLDGDPMLFFIQPMDRENWTYLSANE